MTRGDGIEVTFSLPPSLHDCPAEARLELAKQIGDVLQAINGVYLAEGGSGLRIREAHVETGRIESKGQR